MNENEKDFLKFYLEQTWEENRHLENLRERVTLIILPIAVAIVGFVIQQKYDSETKPLIWFVIILGFFGLSFTLKLYQIHQLNQKRLDKWYKYYEKFCGEDSKILILKEEADEESRKKFFYISKIRHNYFWSTIYIFIIFVGVFLLVTSSSKQNPDKYLKTLKSQKTDSTNVKIDTIKAETVK